MLTRPLLDPLNAPGEKKEGGWSMRTVFSGPAVTAIKEAIKALVVNIEDILLVYLVFILGLSEILGRSFSWRLTVLIVLLLAINVARRFYPLHPVTDVRSDTKQQHLGQ